MRTAAPLLLLLATFGAACASEGDGALPDAGAADAAQDDAATLDSGDGVDGGSCASAPCAAGWICVRSTYSPGTCIEPDDAGVCPTFGHEGAERIPAVPRCCAVYDHWCAPVPESCASDPTCGCYGTSVCPIDHEPSQSGGGCRCTAATPTTAQCSCGGA